jgi:hypothetical protein
VDARVLTPGAHIITLEVQDNEGNWSAPVSAMLEVRQGEQRTYIPLLVR